MTSHHTTVTSHTQHPAIPHFHQFLTGPFEIDDNDPYWRHFLPFTLSLWKIRDFRPWNVFSLHKRGGVSNIWISELNSVHDKFQVWAGVDQDLPPCEGSVLPGGSCPQVSDCPGRPIFLQRFSFLSKTFLKLVEELSAIPRVQDQHCHKVKVKL